VWCDDFDADLLAVVPGAAEALGEAAGVKLLTYSTLTDGKINCPSAWNTYDGSLIAYFWTAPEHRPNAAWYTTDPVVGCTFLEAVRDEWVHSCTIAVNWHVIWKPPDRLMEKLMYDLRGWGTPLAGEQREQIRGDVLASLRAAAGRLTQVPGVPSFAAGVA
jgi:hypothetical protein